VGSFDGTANSQSFSQPVMNYGEKAPASLGNFCLSPSSVHTSLNISSFLFVSDTLCRMNLSCELDNTHIDALFSGNVFTMRVSMA